MNQPTTGDLVYFNYSPSKTGKVVGDLGEDVITHGLTGEQHRSSFHRLRVRLLKTGAVEEVLSCRVKDFRLLIADHRRKLATHEAMLDRLEKEL